MDGDVDMVTLVRAVLDEEAARRNRGRTDHCIVFRPDHGHALLWDIGRGIHPGYPLIGRMRGLAELRGVIHAVSHDARG